MPSFVFLMGDVLDGYNPNADKLHSLQIMGTLCIIFTGIGLGTWLFAYLFFGFMMIFSEKVTRRTRLHYLRHILNLESAFFDGHNYQEFPSKMNLEMAAI